MNAQSKAEALNAQQQSIVAISALTATGDLEKLKTQLKSQPTVPVIEPGMLVRISEIEILPEHLEAYNTILKDEASASVKLEPGVIAIFPMYEQKNPTQLRIIEIYANNAAYQSHLKTPHFLHYKTNTLHMIKSLKLVDMNSLDTATMVRIFKKLN